MSDPNVDLVQTAHAAFGRGDIESWAHHMVVRHGKVVGFEEFLDTSATVLELREARAKA